ncbi:hypothetical protein AB1207_18145 [Kineococcus endophyticus]|uniref:Prepilin-type N-terminal cleavage/methylation domain-containing protein n=1 Tax=Kineococcus endophyticus TaxID=1181883 RepID=A0ABV3PAL8_9ACTN
MSAIARRLRDDQGITLVETLVAMMIFTACFAVFISGLMVMVRDTSRTQNVTDAANQMRKAFSTMDTQARYAESVNQPGVVGTSWYVEFRDPVVNAENPECTQWRYDVSAGTLSTRSWDSTVVVATPWTVLARGLSTDPGLLTDSTRQPFTTTFAAYSQADNADQTRQRITVRLSSPRPVGDGSSRTTAEQLTTTFTALNSDTDSDSNKGSAVCAPTTSRTGA